MYRRVWSLFNYFKFIIMKNTLYTFLLATLVFILYSFIGIDPVKKQEPKKQEPKKQEVKVLDNKKQEVKKQEVKALETKKIESKKLDLKTQDIKISDNKRLLDTLKKEKVLLQTEILLDSIVLFKGKFKPYKMKAHASYYADRFHGKRTASGRVFDMNGMTAAHKKLPFGTKVKVTNEANGKMVIVEVTDRGPFVKGRDIDLSKKAFMMIAGNKNSGNATVTMEVLQN